MREETVLIIHQSPKILLGMKKRKLGKGRYNGFGGGQEEYDENIKATAIRETLEEIGVTPRNVERLGKILFHFNTDKQDHLVHFFKATDFEGDLIETDEMKPEWFDEDKIPYNQMWSDDKYWLPLLLRGQKFTGEFHFDENHQIVKYKLNKVSGLN